MNCWDCKYWEKYGYCWKRREKMTYCAYCQLWEKNCTKFRIWSESQ